MHSLNKHIDLVTYYITINDDNLLRVTHFVGDYLINVQKGTLVNIVATITLDDAHHLGFQSIEECRNAILQAPSTISSNIANESSFIDFSWLWDAFLAFLVNVGKALGSTFSAIRNIQSCFHDKTIHDPCGKPNHH